MSALSIVTISFNQREYLDRAIRSVLYSRTSDIQYIIVDPGSTDGSRELAAEYARNDPRVHTLFEPDSGPSDGLNRGLSAVTSPYVGFLNADDEYLPMAFQIALDAFKDNPGSACVYGHGAFIDAKSHLMKRIRSKRFSLGRYISGTATVLQQATFFRTESIREVQGFNLENRTCWDGEILVDLRLNGYTLTRVDQYLGLFRIHGASITGSGRLTDEFLIDQERIRMKIRSGGAHVVAIPTSIALAWDWISDAKSTWVKLSDRLCGAGSCAWVDSWPGTDH